MRVARPFRANVVMGTLAPGLRCAPPWAIIVRRFAAENAINVRRFMVGYTIKIRRFVVGYTIIVRRVVVGCAIIVRRLAGEDDVTDNGFLSDTC
jgi:hypothetical protein